MAALGVGGLGDAVARHGMVWSHVPIPDLSAPDEQAFRAFLQKPESVGIPKKS